MTEEFTDEKDKSSSMGVARNNFVGVILGDFIDFGPIFMHFRLLLGYTYGFSFGGFLTRKAPKYAHVCDQMQIVSMI